MESPQPLPARQTIRITPSMADAWQDCPRRFAQDHHLTKGADAYSPKLAKGKAVHELLAHANWHLVGGGSFPDPNQLTERFWNPSHFRSSEEAFDAKTDATIMLVNHLKRLQSRHLTVLAYERFKITKPFRIDDYVSVILSGKIDAITEASDGTIAAEDIKTGETLPAPGVLATRLSSTIYHLLARQLYPDAQRIVIMQTVPATGVEVTVALTEDEIKAAKEQIKVMVRAMASDPMMTSVGFAPIMGESCSWCPHRSNCPLYIAADGEEETF